MKPEDVPNRWMDIMTFDSQPLVAKLSGLDLEYRIVQIYSRDKGKREATIGFNVGQGTQDIGFRNEVAVLFECEPAVRVKLSVLDDDGKPTTGAVHHSATSRAASIRRSRGGWPRTSSSTPRSTAPTAKTCCCRRAQYEVTYNRGPEYLVPEEVDHRSGRGRAQRIVPPEALDQADRPRLVLGRSSRPRRRLCPLRSPDRRRHARRHDAAHPGRGPQHRLRPLLGAVLVSPEAVLRRQRSTSSRRRTT